MKNSIFCKAIQTNIKQRNIWFVTNIRTRNNLVSRALIYIYIYIYIYINKNIKKHWQTNFTVHDLVDVHIIVFQGNL